MSTAAAIASEPIPQPRRTSGLSSIKTMFSTKKRHTIAQMPSATMGQEASPTPPEAASPTATTTPTAAVSPLHPQKGHQHQASVASLFTSQKRSAEKAAEKDRKEQAKQTFQLSTIDDQGVFHPPTPMEKSTRERFIDNDADYFDMIINTPPERVKTFLSAEKTISPYMFSAPRSSKNSKRHTIGTYTTPKPWPSLPHRSEFAPTAPHKDNSYDNKMTVQVTVAPQDSEALEEALSNSINSLLDSPTRDTVPDLIEDSGSESPSLSPASSTNVSPRSSTASLTGHPMESAARQETVKRIREQLFGEELPIPF